VRQRRRRILSRPADQFRTTLVPTLGAAILLVVLLTGLHHLTEARTRELAAANPGYADVLAAQSAQTEAALATGAIVYLFGILAIGLMHSRRMMGALFAIHRRILRLADGDLTTVLRLRRGDYFHDVAEAINTATLSARHEAEVDLADTDDLISILDHSPAAVGLRDGLRQTLVEIRARKRRLLDLEETPELRRLQVIEGGKS
jgi:hypothetical protein